MNIKGLEFVMTSSACPEQYDVYDGQRNIVGYIRLRWGGLVCEYPNVWGKVIYSANIGDGWTGWFENSEQRMFHLNAIADKIIAAMKGLGEDQDDC